MDKNNKKKTKEEQEDERWQKMQKGEEPPTTRQDMADLDLLTNWLGGDPWHNQEEE